MVLESTEKSNTTKIRNATKTAHLNEMMKIKDISENAENAEKEEKAEAYISTLKNEINILQNELEMMKLQAEINENSSPTRPPKTKKKTLNINLS